MSKDKKLLCYALAGICLWVGLLLGMYKLYYQPQIAVQQEIIQHKDAMEAQATDYKQQGDLEAKVEALTQQEGKLREQLPAKLDMASFLRELNTMALVSKVELVEVKPGDEEKGQGYVSQNVEVEVQGEFFPLLDFYKKIHLSNRLITLNSGQIYISNAIIKSTLGIKIFALSK